MKSFEVSNKTLLGILFILLLLLKLLSGKAQSEPRFSTTAHPYYAAQTAHFYPGWNPGGTITTRNLRREFNHVFAFEAQFRFICMGSRLVLLQGFTSRSLRMKAFPFQSKMILTKP